MADPEWQSGDPQSWSTYFKACYQIEGAPEVLVELHCRDKRTAQHIARDAMDTALKDLVKHQVRVKAKCYTIKWRTRKQTQTFEPVVEANDEVVTGLWYGSFSVVHAGIAKNEENFK